LYGVRSGEEIPVLIVCLLERCRGACIVARSECEVGGVEDTILVLQQELPGPFMIATDQVAHARGHVDGEIRKGVQPLRQPVEMLFVAA
jgi:hypothetical protein